MTGKIKVHIDPKGYDEKPSGKEIGGIKSRLQKGTRPSLVTLEELVQKIRTGHSISPGIMEGMSAKNWKEQQLFMVDIDNEEDGPILRIKDARAICRDNGLPLAYVLCPNFWFRSQDYIISFNVAINPPAKHRKFLFGPPRSTISPP